MTRDDIIKELRFVPIRCEHLTSSAEKFMRDAVLEHLGEYIGKDGMVLAWAQIVLKLWAERERTEAEDVSLTLGALFLASQGWSNVSRTTVDALAYAHGITTCEAA
jgi:hypothetical protein